MSSREEPEAAANRHRRCTHLSDGGAPQSPPAQPGPVVQGHLGCSSHYTWEVASPEGGLAWPGCRHGAGPAALAQEVLLFLQCWMQQNLPSSQRVAAVLRHRECERGDTFHLITCVGSPQGRGHPAPWCRGCSTCSAPSREITPCLLFLSPSVTPCLTQAPLAQAPTPTLVLT